MAAQRFRIDTMEIIQVKEAMPLQTGGLRFILLFLFSGLFVWFFIYHINAFANKEISGWQFTFSLPFISALIYAMARSITNEPVLSWFKRYYQNNVIGYKVMIYCDLNSDKREISLSVHPRNYKTFCKSSNSLRIFTPLGGWFTKRGGVIVIVGHAPLQPVFKISLFDTNDGIKLKLVDYFGSSQILGINETFLVLESIWQHHLKYPDGTGPMLNCWQDIISNLINSKQAAIEQITAEKDIAISTYQESLVSLKEHMYEFLVELISKLDRTKRFIKSTEALAIKAFTIEMLLLILPPGSKENSKWGSCFDEVTKQLTEVARAKAQKKKEGNNEVAGRS